MKNSLLLEKIEEMVNAGTTIEKPLTMDEACQFMNMSKSKLYKMTFSKITYKAALKLNDECRMMNDEKEK